MKRSSTTSIVILLLVAAVAAGCSRGDRAYRPVVNPEFLNLSKEEIFQRGETLMGEKKWTRARSHYTYVYENYPNDPLGRRSLLRIADTFYNQGGLLNLVEAQYKYRDFINRYPGSELADYSMLQIANVSFKQMEKPDRDQTKTKEAVQKYREMLAAFPGSSHRPEAEEKLQKALDRLAKHEHLVARFYMLRGDAEAALPRLTSLVQTYPDYSDRRDVLLDLGIALDKVGRDAEARLYFERVMAEFPETDAAKRAREYLQSPSA